MLELTGLPHLDAGEVTAMVSMPAAIAAIATALTSAEAGDFDQPPRLALDDGRLLVMAATELTSRASSVKTVSVRIGEPGRRQQDAINGTLLWIDGPTGRPAFTADGALITALRTGAVAGLATDLLAPPDATRLALLGSGRQAMTQLHAACAVRPIRHVVVHSRTAAHARHFAEQARAALPHLQVTVDDNPDRAVAGADVVSCATGSPTPLFATAALPATVHVNAVGSYRTSMAELPTDLLLGAEVIAVDDLIGCRHESGEITAALAAGLELARLHPLGALIAASPTVPARSGRTVFKSVGCAVLDWAVGSLLAATLDGGSHAGSDN